MRRYTFMAARMLLLVVLCAACSAQKTQSVRQTHVHAENKCSLSVEEFVRRHSRNFTFSYRKYDTALEPDGKPVPVLAQEMVGKTEEAQDMQSVGRTEVQKTDTVVSGIEADKATAGTSGLLPLYKAAGVLLAAFAITLAVRSAKRKSNVWIK